MCEQLRIAAALRGNGVLGRVALLKDLLRRRAGRRASPASAAAATSPFCLTAGGAA
eukprot:gene16640-41356_t